MSPSDSRNPLPGPSAINEVFETLSDESRRQALYYLREHDGTADIDELREHLSERTTYDTDEVRTILNHVALPKLEDCGVIDCDSHRDQVRYDGGPLTTELLEWIGDKERKDG